MNQASAEPLPAVPGAVPARYNRAGQKLGFFEEWRDVVLHRDLLVSLVHRDLTIRYKRSPIGFVWTMLHPLLLMGIFVIIFSAIFRFQTPLYPLYFLSQYVAWAFFAQTTIESMVSMEWNGSLLKRVRVPRSIFALASTISGLANLGLSMIPLALIMVIIGAPFRPTLLFLPFSFLVLGIFTLGLSLALSALSVYFVDVREMYKALIPAVMYLTPIIYPISIVPEQFRWIIKLNPMVYLLQLFRAPVYYGIIPTPQTIVLSVIMAAAALLIGWMTFRHLAPNFYPHL
ncbi:MAG TPA: ABC transporter permease [Thermoanaerobaculia bacterium]|nr:ABC transporter permease [Thermoanaerobaculia bacterium]